MKWRLALLTLGLTLVGLSRAVALVGTDGAELQRKMAEEQWKELLADKSPAFQETEHFLLYGTVNAKELDACAKTAERAIPIIKKTLRLEKAPAWKGKLAIFLFQERSEFASFERNVSKRNPEREDRGGHYHFPQWSLVTVGPGATAKSLPNDLEIAQHIAAAALTIEHGSTVPEWLVSGYGRSIAYRLSPRTFSEERQRAAQYLRSRTFRDLSSGGLSREEGPVLNASFADYLANGVPQNPALLQTVLIAHGLRENGTIEQALAAARIAPEILDAGWRSWTAKVK
jgi:hypothetical protein